MGEYVGLARRGDNKLVVLVVSLEQFVGVQHLTRGENVAGGPLPNADFVKDAEVSNVVDAHSLGALLNIPNQSWRVTRSDVGETGRVLEDRLGRGVVDNHFFGGGKGRSR